MKYCVRKKRRDPAVHWRDCIFQNNRILSYTGCNAWSAWLNRYSVRVYIYVCVCVWVCVCVCVCVCVHTSRVPCIWGAAVISTRYSTACLIHGFFIRTWNQELISSSGVVIWLSSMLKCLLSLRSYVTHYTRNCDLFIHTKGIICRKLFHPCIQLISLSDLTVLWFCHCIDISSDGLF